MRGDSREQLARVAHRADRIADLVRDARAEPAERRELRLLDALGDQRRVLEEDHDAAVAVAAERREVRLDVVVPSLPSERARVRRRTFAAVRQVGAVRRARPTTSRDRLAGSRRAAAELLRSRLVDQANCRRCRPRRCSRANAG